MTNHEPIEALTDSAICSIAWAAERLGVSQRQVLRYVHDGTLRAVTPLRGSTESIRHKRVLHTGTVRALDAARTGHFRDDARVCFASCPHEDHGNV